jgi:hypothetical protein
MGDRMILLFMILSTGGLTAVSAQTSVLPPTRRPAGRREAASIGRARARARAHLQTQRAAIPQPGPKGRVRYAKTSCGLKVRDGRQSFFAVGDILSF